MRMGERVKAVVEYGCPNLLQYGYGGLKGRTVLPTKVMAKFAVCVKNLARLASAQSRYVSSRATANDFKRKERRWQTCYS